MRSFKRLCVLLALALAWPGGVAAAETSQVAMGRYVEAALSLPADGELYFAQTNGLTYAVDGSGDNLYTSADLINWSQSKTGHDEQASPALGGVNGIAVGADGGLFLGSAWAMREEDRNLYVEHIENGEARHVTLEQNDTLSTTGYLPMHALPSGELLTLGGQGVYRFSRDGKLIKQYPVVSASRLAVHGHELAVYSQSEAQISVLDIETGEVLRTLAPPIGAGYYGQLDYDAEGALWFACANGLYRVNAGGTLMAQVVDGRLATLGTPGFSVQQILFDAENNPVIVYTDYQTYQTSLIGYRYDEHVPTEPDTVLSVFALYDTSTVSMAASEFQKANPDVLVNVTVGLPDGTAVTRDDAIRSLNTEILAGKGPDVIVLDGLPVQSYLDKGVLLDLSDALQPLIAEGKLLEAVASAYAKNGAIAAVPVRFLMPTLWGDVDGLKTLEDMARWAQANPDALPYYAVDAESLIGTFYLSCAPAWMGEDGRLSETQIEAFFSALKAIRGNWTYPEFVAQTGWDIKAMAKERGFLFPEWNPYLRPAGMNAMEESMGMNLMSDGKQKQLPYLLRGFDTVAFPNGLLARLNTGDFVALPGQAEGCFVPALTMSASRGTANGELAKKFILTALGEAVQSVDIMEGFPVNVQALDAEQAREATHFGTSGNGTYSSQWPDQARRDRLREMIDGLKTPVTCDFTLYRMLVDEGAQLFDGRIDVQQATANVCAKANAYLSE